MLATAIKKKEQEWFKEGRIEERRETARKMKQEHVPIDIIIRVTGLSREEIEKL
ncbi:MAG: hypothetical protein LDL24_10100 [Treponema sp.]|nr:hypothetical protein [Treponema sp.]